MQQIGGNLPHPGNPQQGEIAFLQRPGVLGLALDVDLPAHQSGSQSYILTPLANGQGQLVVRDDDLHGLGDLVQDDATHLSRGQGIGGELGRIRMPGNDVDLLARSSWTMFCTREPRMPTQAPTGSTSDSREATAILARLPGSRAQPNTWTIPSEISGTSASKRAIRNCGWVRERMTWGPRVCRLTSRRKVRMRSPLWYVSRGTCSDGGNRASVRPRLTMIPSGSTRWTMPLTISPLRSLKSSKTRSRSASFMRCMITCFAEW